MRHIRFDIGLRKCSERKIFFKALAFRIRLSKQIIIIKDLKKKIKLVRYNNFYKIAATISKNLVVTCIKIITIL